MFTPKKKQSTTTLLESSKPEIQSSTETLLCHESLQVNLLNSLPPSFQTLSNSYEYVAHVEKSMSLASLSFQDKLVVWNYRKQSQPVYFEFMMPSSFIYTLIPFVNPRKCGILACTRQGLVRFWENVSLGPQGFAQLTLPVGHPVMSLHAISPWTFIISTAKTLYKIMIDQTFNSLTYQVLSKPTSVLSRFIPFSGFTIPEALDVVSVLTGPDTRHGKEILILSTSTLSKWILSKSMDKYIQEFQLNDLIFKSIERDMNQYVPLKTFIQDAVLLPSNDMICLVKFSVDELYSYFVLVYIQLDATDIFIKDKKQLMYKQPCDLVRFLLIHGLGWSKGSSELS